MSTISRFLRGTRALLNAARSAAFTPKPTTPPSSTKKPTRTAAAAPLDAPKKKKIAPDTGIMKVKPISLALQNIVGAPEISRGEAVKKVWAYIKEKNLQNPLNKREILCDAKLKKLFDGKDKVGFLEVAKLLSPHFVKIG